VIVSQLVSEDATFQARFVRALDRARLEPEALEAATGKAFTARTVRRWIRGDTAPGVESLPILCPLLGVSADWLVGLTDDPTPR
jgi:transcriptional regulator with XRE-family HTH domain